MFVFGPGYTPGPKQLSHLLVFRPVSAALKLGQGGI